MTHPLDSYVPSLDRAVVQTRYDQLCEIRDKTITRTASLRKQLETEANEAEAARVKSMATAAKLYTERGGDKWFALKKEIGILAKTLSGILPPTPEQVAQAQSIEKAVK
jgi:hypothetical protein